MIPLKYVSKFWTIRIQLLMVSATILAGCSSQKDSVDADLSTKSNQEVLVAFSKTNEDQAARLGTVVKDTIDISNDASSKTVASRIMLSNGKTQAVTLMNPQWLRNEVASSLKVGSKADNWLKVYKSRYQSLSDEKKQGLIRPDQLTHGSRDDIKKYLAQILSVKGSHTADVEDEQDNTKKPKISYEAILKDFGIEKRSNDFSKFINSPTAFTFDHDCSAELGYDLGNDMTGSTESFSSLGIMKNVFFKLRNHMTCVKNQGYRGSCNAFAISGAVETLISRDYGMFTNLSEQNAYFWMLTEIDKDYNEGAPTNEVVEGMASKSYKFYLESKWNYNPGYNRDICPNDESLASCAEEDRDWTNSFGNICAGYSVDGVDWSGDAVSSIGGEMCTETVHEATLLEGHERKEGAIAFSTPGSSTLIRLGSTELIWDLSDTSASLDLVKDYLRDGVPLIVGMAVTHSFESPSSGYVSTYTSEEEVTGGHAIMVIGAISNNRLPVGAPEGLGGGYLVVKNSWGATAGDHGYYYIPYQYALDRFTHVYPIESLVL